MWATYKNINSKDLRPTHPTSHPTASCTAYFDAPASSANAAWCRRHRRPAVHHADWNWYYRSCPLIFDDRSAFPQTDHPDKHRPERSHSARHPLSCIRAPFDTTARPSGPQLEWSTTYHPLPPITSCTRCSPHPAIRRPLPSVCRSKTPAPYRLHWIADVIFP